MALVPCKKCGALISDKADACPVCNTPVNEIEENVPSTTIPSENTVGNNAPKEDVVGSQMAKDFCNPEKKENKKPWILLASILTIFLFLAVGVFLFLGNDGDSSSVTSDDINETIIEQQESSSDYIKNAIEMRLNDICKDLTSCKPTDKHLSKEFNNLLNKGWELGEVDFMDCDMWLDAQDSETITVEVLRFKNFSEKSVDVELHFIDSWAGKKPKKTIRFISEEGNWLVDDIINEGDKSVKEYARDFIRKYGEVAEAPQELHRKYTGSINEKYPIEMTLHLDNGYITGVYHYTKTGSGADLRLEGTYNEDGRLELVEYDDNNVSTGRFIGRFFDTGISGNFINGKNKEMPFALFYIEEL